MGGLTFIGILLSLPAVLIILIAVGVWWSNSRYAAVPIEEISASVRQESNERLAFEAALNKVGLVFGVDEHWKSWGVGILEPGDPSSLVLEVHTMPRTLHALYRGDHMKLIEASDREFVVERMVLLENQKVRASKALETFVAQKGYRVTYLN